MILPVLVFAGAAGTLELSDQTQLHLRASQSTTAQPTTLELWNSPTARATVKDHEWDVTAALTPVLMLSDEPDAPTPQAQTFDFVLNGSIAAGWHDRYAHLVLREDGSFARENTANYVATTTLMPGVVAPQATAANVDTASSRTTLLGEYRASHQTQLTLDVGYFQGGGLTAADQQTIALQHGPFADAQVSYAPSRTDAFLVRANAVATDSEAAASAAPGACSTGATTLSACAPSDVIASATVGWRRALSRLSDGTVGVGAGFVRSRTDVSQPYVSAAYPVAGAAYEYKLRLADAPGTLRVDAQLAPTIDLRAGSPDYRAQGTVTVVSTSIDFTLSEAAGAARSLPMPTSGVVTVQPSTFLSSTTTAEYRVSKTVGLGAMLSVVYQHQDALPATPGAASQAAGDLLSEIVSLAVTVRALPARF